MCHPEGATPRGGVTIGSNISIALGKSPSRLREGREERAGRVSSNSRPHFVCEHDPLPPLRRRPPPQAGEVSLLYFLDPNF
jgi:hypothetical protein